MFWSYYTTVCRVNMTRKKLTIFQNQQRRNFIHHFLGIKVLEEKKIYIDS